MWFGALLGVFVVCKPTKKEDNKQSFQESMFAPKMGVFGIAFGISWEKEYLLAKPEKGNSKTFFTRVNFGHYGGWLCSAGGGERSFLDLFCSVKCVWCNQTIPSGAKRTIIFGNCRRMVLADFSFSFSQGKVKSIAFWGS